jgi:hypothetical protein
VLFCTKFHSDSDDAQCGNQEKTLSEIQNRVPKCVEHGKIAENVGKVVFLGGGLQTLKFVFEMDMTPKIRVDMNFE